MEKQGSRAMLVTALLALAYLIAYMAWGLGPKSPEVEVAAASVPAVDEGKQLTAQVAAAKAKRKALAQEVAQLEQMVRAAAGRAPPPPTGPLARPAAAAAAAAQGDALSPAEAKVGRGFVHTRVFVVTYKSDKELGGCLDSLLASDLTKKSFEIIVLNNFGVLILPAHLISNANLHVLNNYRRPDWSTGHLARDWNQCLVNGFQSLDKPTARQVVCMQADNKVTADFASTLAKLHKSYVLVSAGLGDAFTSYTADAIKQIGLWDERYSNIGWQETDFYMRSIMFAGDRVCFMQKEEIKVHSDTCPCPKTAKNVLSWAGSGNRDKKKSHLDSRSFHPYSRRVFEEKWPGITNDKPDQMWGLNAAAHKRLKNTRRTPAIPTFVRYPYFEKHIPNINELGISPAFEDSGSQLEWQCERLRK